MPRRKLILIARVNAHVTGAYALNRKTGWRGSFSRFRSLCLKPSQSHVNRQDVGLHFLGEDYEMTLHY